MKIFGTQREKTCEIERRFSFVENLKFENIFRGKFVGAKREKTDKIFQLWYCTYAYVGKHFT